MEYRFFFSKRKPSGCLVKVSTTSHGLVLMIDCTSCFVWIRSSAGPGLVIRLRNKIVGSSTRGNCC